MALCGVSIVNWIPFKLKPKVALSSTVSWGSCVSAPNRVTDAVITSAVTSGSSTIISGAIVTGDPSSVYSVCDVMVIIWMGLSLISMTFTITIAVELRKGVPLSVAVTERLYAATLSASRGVIKHRPPEATSKPNTALLRLYVMAALTPTSLSVAINISNPQVKG